MCAPESGHSYDIRLRYEVLDLCCLFFIPPNTWRIDAFCTNQLHGLQSIGPGTGGLRREPAPVPCTPTMASDHAPTKTLTASGPPTRGWRDFGGLISRSRRMFSTAPEGSYPSGAYPHHRSPQQLTSVRKRPPEDTPVAVFLRYWAPQEVQSGSADLRSSESGQEDDGGYPATKGTDPETELSGTTVSRYGHLRSAPVVGDAGFRTEWEPHTLRASLLDSTRQCWRLLEASFLSSDERDTTCPEGRERYRDAQTRLRSQDRSE